MTIRTAEGTGNGRLPILIRNLAHIMSENWRVGCKRLCLDRCPVSRAIRVVVLRTREIMKNAACLHLVTS